MVLGPCPCCDCTSGRFLGRRLDPSEVSTEFERHASNLVGSDIWSRPAGADRLAKLFHKITTLRTTHIFVFASERYDGEKAESEPVPRLNAMGRPVAAVVTLRSYAFVALQRAGKVWGRAVSGAALCGESWVDS